MTSSIGYYFLSTAGKQDYAIATGRASVQYARLKHAANLVAHLVPIAILAGYTGLASHVAIDRLRPTPPLTGNAMNALPLLTLQLPLLMVQSMAKAAEDILLMSTPVVVGGLATFMYRGVHKELLDGISESAKGMWDPKEVAKKRYQQDLYRNIKYLALAMLLLSLPVALGAAGGAMWMARSIRLVK